SDSGASRIRLHLDAVDLDRVTVHSARDGHFMAGVGYHFVLVGNLVHLAVAHENSRSATLDAARCAGRVVFAFDFIGCLARTCCIRDIAGPIRGHRTHRTKRKHRQYFFHNAPSALKNYPVTNDYTAKYAVAASADVIGKITLVNFADAPVLNRTNTFATALRRYPACASGGGWYANWTAAVAAIASCPPLPESGCLWQCCG